MIVFAIVLYGVTAPDCVTLKSLKESLAGIPPDRCSILLLDNSPSGFSIPDLSDRIVYRNLGGNVGLARAYNHAIAHAVECKADHLVTLDQDSTVTPEYIAALHRSLGRVQGDVIALCPRIRSHGRVVSPYSFNALGLPDYGASRGHLHAINSFTLYSVPFLVSIGGFDEHYWLDALDFSTFARIRRSGARVLPLDVEVAHDLSLVSGSVREWRMVNIVQYEACFLLEYCSLPHVVTGLSRLLVRAMRLRRHGLRPGLFQPLLRVAAQGARTGLRRRWHRTPLSLPLPGARH